MASQNPSTFFDAYYYAHGCAAPYERTPELLGFFETIAERITNDIRPASVLDAGCAMGFLVESLRKRGVEAYGVDVSAFAIQQAHPDIRPYCQVGSIADPFPRKYDLIVSIEVLEHMPQADAERVVTNFCQFSQDVLFSSTPFDYKEVTHFNVQPPEVWAELFARQGFFRDVDFDAGFITPWAVRFRARSVFDRRNEPVHRLVRDYERKFWLLWKENSDLRKLTAEMREQAVASETEKQSLNVQLAGQGRTAQTVAKQKDQQIQALTAQLAEVEHSVAWRLVQKWWGFRLKIAPHGSRRERWLLSLRRRLEGKS